MAVAGKLFELGVDSAPGEGGSALVRFPPGARQELVLLSVLSPQLASNVAVPYEKRLFASDASLSKGAYTHMRPPPGVIEALWLAADSKGFYTKLDRPTRSSLASLGIEPLAPLLSVEPEDEEKPERLQGPCRPLGQRFDFLLVGPGAAALVDDLRAAGLCCGPILDSGTSPHFRLDCPDATEWAMHLASSGRLGALGIYLRSGATSVLRRVGCTVKAGRAPGRRIDHVLAHCFALFWVAWRMCLPAVLVSSGTSVVCSTPGARFLCRLPGVNSVGLPACVNSRCHRGSLRLLCSDARDGPAGPALRCCATGSPGRPAGHFVSGLSRRIRAALAAAPSPDRNKPGYESLLVNDLLSTGTWRVGAAWRWPRPLRHINVLETEAYLATLRDMSRRGGDRRSVHIVDSAVSLGATSKGRSSARTLRRALLQGAALQLSFGLFLWAPLALRG